MKRVLGNLKLYIIGLVLLLPSILVIPPNIASADVSFDGGDGSEATPYLISDCTQLQSIDDFGDTEGVYFALNTDIDCSATNTWNDNGSGGFEGFIPIGTNDYGFKGNFDGNDFEISGLYINRPSDGNIGLFSGFEGSPTVVRDLEISGANITGSSDIGVLVGYSANATISNVVTGGTVSGSGFAAGGFAGRIFGGTVTDSVSHVSVSGDDATGGFAGLSGCGAVISDSYSTGDVAAPTGSAVGGFSGADGCEGPGSTMTNVFSSGNVWTNANYVGGLIGEAINTTLIETFATGTVESDNGNTVGGLVGNITNSSITRSFSAPADGTLVRAPMGDTVGGLAGSVVSSTITDSYSRHNVTAPSIVGGLVGHAEDSNITNSYSTGNVAHTSSPAGGLVGDGNSTDINNSFWDTQTSGMTTDFGATGKTTSQMKTAATFTDAGWDFDSVWVIYSAESNDGYPCHQWYTDCIVGSFDIDNVPTEIEAGAPNSGDANNDGMPDSEQPRVTSLPSPVSGQYVVLESSVCTSNASVQVNKEPLPTNQDDDNYQYPLGLLGFTLSGCNVGGSETITQYYYGDYDASKVTLRKYNPTTHVYTTITNATITNVTIGGQKAVKVVYTVVDGGALDLDGVANGTIVDPAGIGLLATSTLAPNTGFNPQSFNHVFIMLGIGSLFFLGSYYYGRRERAFRTTSSSS